MYRVPFEESRLGALAPGAPRRRAGQEGSVRALIGAILFLACMPSVGAGPAVGIVVKASTAAAAGIAASIHVRGCVVDASYIPHAGAVILRAQDGRLITRALTDPNGTFVVRVPPQQRINVALDVPNGDALTFPVGTRDVVIDSCLRDDVD